MKRVFFSILLIFLMFLLQQSAFSEQLGILECNNSKYFVNSNLTMEPTFIQNKDLITLNSKDVPILYIACYNNLDTTAIENYIRKDGKIILSVPSSSLEFNTFKNLSKFLGVNIENIEALNIDTEVYWIEKTLLNNYLTKNSKIAKATVEPETKVLAVFGQLEKHESAITLNDKGAVILWRWGEEGQKTFNNKNFHFLLNEMAKNISIDITSSQRQSFSDGIKELSQKRSETELYLNNTLNFSCDLSSAQEEIEKSKVAEIYAKNSFKNQNITEALSLLNQSKQHIFNSIGKISMKPSYENHGIWFDRGTIVNIKSQEEMGKKFDILKQSGIQTIYFETFNAGFTIYPSNLAQQNPSVKGLDPLKWAVVEAHKRNMKIHTWLWIFAVGNTRHNSIINKSQNYEGPVLSAHPEWALIGANGNYLPKNQPEFWIDPANLQGKKFIISLGQEIIKKYDVDGIQLDYIRYPFQKTGNLMGFNPSSMEQFQNETGEKLLSLDNNNLNMWNKWKEHNINRFVEDFSKSCKKLRPSLKISASVFCKPYIERLSTIQQNWEQWAKISSVDIITPMSYSTSTKALSSNINLFPSVVSENCLIYPGIALKHVSDTDILNQIETIRNSGYCGMTFFAYSQLDDKQSCFLQNNLFNIQTFDPTYSKSKAANSYINEYKKTLETYLHKSNDLSENEKVMLNDLLQKTNAILFKLNNVQNSKAADDITKLIELTDLFEKKYMRCYFCRSLSLSSYLKRARNLL